MSLFCSKYGCNDSMDVLRKKRSQSRSLVTDQTLNTGPDSFPKPVQVHLWSELSRSRRGNRVACKLLGEALRPIIDLHHISSAHFGQSPQPHCREIPTCKMETATAACKHLSKERPPLVQ